MRAGLECVSGLAHLLLRRLRSLKGVDNYTISKYLNKAEVPTQILRWTSQVRCRGFGHISIFNKFNRVSYDHSTELLGYPIIEINIAEITRECRSSESNLT